MGQDISIVSTASSHLKSIAAIEIQVSPHPWSLVQFSESLANHSCYTLLQGQAVTGYAVLSVILPGTDGEAELLNIAVLPECQGQGLGRYLLGFCLGRLAGRASRLFLEVRASNIQAIGLYLGMGFRQVSRRRDYYSLASGGSEDGLLMMRSITHGE